MDAKKKQGNRDVVAFLPALMILAGGLVGSALRGPIQMLTGGDVDVLVDPRRDAQVTADLGAGPMPLEGSVELTVPLSSLAPETVGMLALGQVGYALGLAVAAVLFLRGVWVFGQGVTGVGLRRTGRLITATFWVLLAGLGLGLAGRVLGTNMVCRDLALHASQGGTAVSTVGLLVLMMVGLVGVAVTQVSKNAERARNYFERARQAEADAEGLV